MLRSGTLGDTLREKIRNAILSALQKGADLTATLPPAVRGNVTIDAAEFREEGGGHLSVLLGGVIRITHEQLQALSRQVKERVAAR